MVPLRFLELAHFPGKVFQLLRAKQNMLVLALFDDPIKHFTVELGAFLEHGQSEGRLHVPPVEEPVVQEVCSVNRPSLPQIERKVFVIPAQPLIVCQSIHALFGELD